VIGEDFDDAALTDATMSAARHHSLFFSAKLKLHPCLASCRRMIGHLLAILSLGGLTLIVAAPLWQ